MDSCDDDYEEEQADATESFLTYEQWMDKWDAETESGLCIISRHEAERRYYEELRKREA